MKKNIAVAMGGYSTERPVSLNSGAVVYKHLPRDKYDVYRVDIAPEGWFLITDGGEKYVMDKNDFSATVKGKKITFDAVFNAIHGTPGEDGLFQAYLRLLDIPHTTSGFFESALTFNKRECIAVLRQYGIKTAKSIFITQGDDIDSKKIVRELGLPLFVKPNGAGSSMGISKVYEENHIVPAIKKAYEEDRQVLIESFLQGREVSVGVMRLKGKITVLPITEIVSENDFFDYQAKYEGKSREITPADLPADVEHNVRRAAELCYEKLNCSGITRSEFIIVGGEPHFLECNTSPGLSEMSIAPRQAEAMGMKPCEFFAELTEQALKTKKR